MCAQVGYKITHPTILFYLIRVQNKHDLSSHKIMRPVPRERDSKRITLTNIILFFVKSAPAVLTFEKKPSSVMWIGFFLNINILICGYIKYPCNYFLSTIRIFHICVVLPNKEANMVRKRTHPNSNSQNDCLVCIYSLTWKPCYSFICTFYTKYD